VPRPARGTPHLLAVAEGPASFAALAQALAAAGLRAGWLELRRPEPLPASLDAAAAAGLRRAVAAGGGRSVAVKALAGAPVLRDLLREHFAGCVLVLVSGGAAAEEAGEAAMPLPRLAPHGEAWRIERPGGAAGGQRNDAVRHVDTAGLVAELRRPHPWFKPTGAANEGKGDNPPEP
jgi:hypothetical protein